MELKEQRFVVVPGDSNLDPQMIFLTDYKFWAKNESDLQSWCNMYNSNFMGMTVTVPNESVLLLFLLRWS